MRIKFTNIETGEEIIFENSYLLRNKVLELTNNPSEASDVQMWADGATFGATSYDGEKFHLSVVGGLE